MTRPAHTLWVAIAIAIAVAVAAGVAAGSQEPGGKRPSEEERPNQPKAEVSARENPLARSTAPRVATGPYVSVQVNVDAAGQNIVGDAANEPSLAVNPLNPMNMVIGWRQFDTIGSDFREAGYAYTFNRGATWTFPGVLEPGVFRSDPVVDFDSLGNIFYQSLTVAAQSLRVDVFRSPDGGRHWTSGGVFEFGGDKNWFVIDRSEGPGHGYHYGIWQRYSACCGAHVFTRSVNGGASYSGPTAIARWPTFGMLAVGPDSTVFAAGIDASSSFLNDWDPFTFVVARTTNAPNPDFPPTSAATEVDLAGSMGMFMGGPNPAGLIGQANIAVDRSTGPTRGNVYVTASVIPDGFEASRVSFSRSVDGGLTFSPPVRINDDPVVPNHWHWLAAHAVAPNGRIDMIWYDSRDGRTVYQNRLYYAYSWDAGLIWSPNVPVSPVFDSSVGWPTQQKMGDYSGIVSDAAGADVAYAATFNGEQDVYYLRLFPDCNGNGVSDVTDVATHQSADCNLSHIPDECEAQPSCIGAGSVPDGGSIPGAPLTIARGAGDAIVLSWGASCSTADADYAAYEGALGDFASHAPRTCSTGGARSLELSPTAGDAYYLIVPIHADREGSYGTGIDGLERPQGASACALRVVSACGG